MKRRTYEYYCIVRNLGRDDEEFVHRFEKLERADELLRQAQHATRDGDTVYLVRLNVIEKFEINRTKDHE